jgi:3-phenylpropionate/trans-cinnamate dioxygenase ferredoxin component
MRLMRVAEGVGNRIDVDQGDCRVQLLDLILQFTSEITQSKMPQCLEAARIEEIANRKCKAIIINGSAVALFNLDGEYFAIKDFCIHLGIDLSGGWLEGDRLACPWHLPEFSIRTGEALTAPAFEGVRSFPVPIRDGLIEVCDDRS